MQQLKYLIQMVFRLGKKHQKLELMLQLVRLVIGTGDAEKLKLDTETYSEHGTAKIQVEGEAWMFLFKSKDPEDKLYKILHLKRKLQQKME